MNNRPDLLTEATLVRAFKIYLEQIKTPTITLAPHTTQMVIDHSVLLLKLRLNRSDLSLLLLSSETSPSTKKHIKLSSQPNKNFTILFAELENMHRLELMIWTQSKAHSNM